MINAKKQVKIYNDAKRYFEKQHSDVTHEDLTKRIINSTFNIDLCIETFKELISSLDNVSAQNDLVVKNLKKRVNHQFSILNEFREVVEIQDNEKLKTVYTDLYQTFTNSTDIEVKTKIFVSHLHELVVEQIIYTLFYGILKNRDINKFEREMVKLFKFLLNISQFGYFTSCIENIRDSYISDTLNAKKADNYLNFLDSFIQTTSVWCLTTQFVIDFNYGLLEPESLKMEDSINTLKLRMDNLYK